MQTLFQNTPLNRTILELKLASKAPGNFDEHFKSYHFGIETAEKLESKLVPGDTLNRTILELNQRAIFPGIKSVWSLNRTILELKQASDCRVSVADSSLNRTILELKHGIRLAEHDFKRL